VRDALKAYLSLATGLTEVTRQRAVAAARALVSQGEATAEQVSTLAEDLVAQTRANREAVSALAKFEVDRTLGRVGLASADEVGALAARVRAVETELRSMRSAAGAGVSAAASTDSPERAPETPAKNASAKKASKRAAAMGVAAGQTTSGDGATSDA